jgi:hypothetical protein
MEMRLSSNMTLNEKLDYIAKGETLEIQVNRAREVAKLDVTFAPLMRMAVIAEEKLSGLPEGMPDTYKQDTALPDGIANTFARQEFRRIKNFLPNGSMQKVPAHKRELSWIQMLEGMHWKEANILVHIKDQTLLQVYPNMREVLTSLGAKINIKETQETQETPKKKKPKKS